MICIEIDIPHRMLSPNYRIRTAQGARGVSALKRAQKEAAYYKIKATNQVPEVPWKKARVHVAYYDKQKRGHGRDRDNATASLKAALDGIAAAGVVENDNGFYFAENIQFNFDKDNPRVVIGVEQIEEAA